MATLLTLANETLLQIIDETRPDSIWSFVRCCKRVWILGGEGLEQHRLDIGRYRAPNFCSWKKHESDIRTYEFVSEVLLQPRRALYVNSISILSRDFTNIRFVGIPSTGENQTMIDRVCGLIFRTVPYPYIQDVEFGEWEEKLRSGNTDAVLCLALTLLPNLKTLGIDHYHGQGFSDMIYKISKAINSPDCKISGSLPLNKLDSITVDVDRGLTQIHEKIGVFEACMTLPSLRRIKGRCIDSTFDRWPPEEAFLCVSYVTEVIFDESAISAQAFTNLLMRVKGLQRLWYNYTPLTSISEEYSAINLKAVIEQYAARTLTHLDLGFNGYRLQFIGSLRQLPSLQHLRIQADMFVDYVLDRECLRQSVDLLPLLPASIEYLNLHCPWGRSSATFTMDDLGKKRKEFLPNLKTFVRERRISITNELIEELASVGIDLCTVESAKRGKTNMPRSRMRPRLEGFLDNPSTAYWSLRS